MKLVAKEQLLEAAKKKIASGKTESIAAAGGEE